MFKKILSLLLCLLTLCSIIPMTALTASAAAEAVSTDIKISNFKLTTKSMTEPKIDTGTGGMFYDGTSVTINSVTYGPGDQFPAGALNVGDYRTVTVKFTAISGCYFVDKGDVSKTYAGKVTVGGQEVTAYVSGSTLKVKFRINVMSPDITTAITVDGVDFPVHGAEARSSVLTSKTTMSHSGLKVTNAFFAFQKSGNTTWYAYPNNTLDSNFSYNKFAFCVEYEVDPAYNLTGFVDKITWNGQKVSGYNNLTSGKGYRLYFNCDIVASITNSVVIRDIDPPVHGTTPDRTGTAPHGLVITKIEYFKNRDRSEEFNGTFDAVKHTGDDYIALGIELKAMQGYTFNPKTLMVHCNGQLSNGYVTRDDGKYVYVFNLTVVPKVITDINITDIDIPVHGATPDRTGTASEGIEITKIQYVKASDRSGEFKGTFDATKHVGKDYIELGVEIKAKPGYSFDRPAVWCNGELSTARVDRGDGKYVYVFPLVIAEGFINPFVDVKESDYFYSAVAWAVPSGVTAGVDATHFGPNKTCTRAQAVTFIYRAAGSPDVSGVANPFKDVKESDYFYNAVLWAVQNGITAGMSADTFAPNGNCTRAQIVCFIHRWAGSPEVANAANPFKDVKESDYFYKAVLWAVENNITAGMSATTFAPNNKCTRGQIVCFLQRWMQQGELEIVAQPKDYKMKSSSEDATYSVTVKGDSYPFTYTWYVYKDGTEESFVKRSYATTSTFSYRFTDYDFEDHQTIVVYCVIRDVNGQALKTVYANIYSKEGDSFAPHLGVVSNPADYQMSFSQEEAKFVTTVSGGVGPYTYTWYVQMDNDEFIQTIKSAETTCNFSREFTDYDFEDYRQILVYCVVRSADGQVVTTNTASVFGK